MSCTVPRDSGIFADSAFGFIDVFVECAVPVEFVDVFDESVVFAESAGVSPDAEMSSAFGVGRCLSRCRMDVMAVGCSIGSRRH